MMAARKPISKKTRFEIFKRDSFTCQYCGHKSPDVLLAVDHISPVAKGGTNDILNLITSCRDCNSGKSDRLLADTTILDKQRQQLEDLQERKEQIEMMFQWQKGLHDLDEQIIHRLSEHWSHHVPGYCLSENGIKGLKLLNRKFEIDEIMNAIKIATEQYLEFVEGKPTKESVEIAWKKIGGICTYRRREKENPNEGRLFYIRGIIRNRLSYINERVALQLLQDALYANASIESLERHAKNVRTWSEWRNGLEDFIDKQNQDDAEGVELDEDSN